tara:strand:+ start:805 stop:1341 length:537 start_codon:yes stop_codon:yes gene_type:complete
MKNNYSQFEKIKLIVSDVDGVLTDGRILINSDSEEGKFFHVEDGTAAALAKYANIPIALISGRYSESTKIRAKELSIEHCYQDVLNKKFILDKLINIYSVNYNEVAYIGDSLVDIPVLSVVGLPISVPSAHKLAQDCSVYITKKDGGEGVLLEVVEEILKKQNRFDEILNLMKKDKFD